MKIDTNYHVSSRGGDHVSRPVWKKNNLKIMLKTRIFERKIVSQRKEWIFEEETKTRSIDKKKLSNHRQSRMKKFKI